MYLSSINDMIRSQVFTKCKIYMVEPISIVEILEGSIFVFLIDDFLTNHLVMLPKIVSHKAVWSVEVEALDENSNLPPPHWSDDASFDSLGHHEALILAKLLNVDSFFHPNKYFPRKTWTWLDTSALGFLYSKPSK